jgi:hypothetical protein
VGYSYVTVTGSFPGQSGTVTFTPSSAITDLTGTIAVLGPVVFGCPLSGGSFTSPPLLATDNPGLLPAGWTWEARIALQGTTPYGYPVLVPSSPSSTTLSALSVSAGTAITAAEATVDGGNA